MKQFVIPYIMYKDTLKAIEFYKKNLGGTIRYAMYGRDMPGCPEDQLDSVMHMEYELNGHVIYMADKEVEDHGRIHIHLDYTNLDDVTKSFNNMKQESTVLQELKQEFWGAIYGALTDPFGVTWQFHYSLPKE